MSFTGGFSGFVRRDWEESPLLDLIQPAKRFHEVDRVLSTCQTCHGRIVAATDALNRSYTGGWLHTHGSSWADGPHEAVPTETGAANLTARMPAAGT